MSAIIGVYHFDDRPVDQALLDRMVDHAAPWPADGQGVWTNGAIGFGHRMLHTTPESLHEKLPFRDADRFTITADARIDNRREIMAELSLGNGNPATVTDSELILKAYDKWGEHCPEHLIGDFAFAIWDESRQKLFCARDPMGIRPFFYYHSDRLFVFGSSLEPILLNTYIPQQLNEFRLACFLTQNFDDRINTFYKNIVRLPGSHCLVIEDGRCRTWQYWEFDPEYEIRLSSDAEYEEAMREVFFESVRCRLRSAFPVGSHLSGGLDSSSIVCAARKILQEKNGLSLHSFSAIFPESAKLDPRIDERPYIDAVAKLDNIIHHNVIADQGTPLVDILWSQAEPIPGMNLYMDCLLENCARQQGVRVLLIGHDGDTTISHGYDLFPELAKKLQWIKLYREVRSISTLWDQPFLRSIYRLGVRPLIPKSWINARRFLRGKRGPPLSQQGLKLNRSFSKRVGMEEYIKELHEKEKATSHHSPRRDHLSSITSGLMYSVTEMVRFVADHAMLEINCPFCDRRMIELCLALPLEQKMRNGYNRSIMRRAMNGLLPPLVQSRVKKSCLTVNFTKGMHDQTETLIKNIFESTFFHDYIDVDEFKKKCYRFKSEPLLVDKEAINMFLAVVSVQWFRQKGIS